MRRITLPITLSALALGLSACGGDHASHGANSPVAEDGREIEVTAGDLAFDPTELTVTAGEELTIVLTTEDGQHDFTIDELDAHVVVGAGDTARGGFRAEDPGRYLFYCSVPGHRVGGMEGELVVE